MTSNLPIAGCLIPYLIQAKEDTSANAKVIFSPDDINRLGSVIVQIKQQKEKSQPPNTKYFETILSDSKHLYQAVMMQQFPTFSIIKISQFQVQKSKGYILNATCEQLNVGQSLIGSPVLINFEALDSKAKQPQPTPQPHTKPVLSLPKSQSNNNNNNNRQDPSAALVDPGLANRDVMPISQLSSSTTDFCIEAIVRSKGPVRTWSKATSSGSLMSFELSDANGEIKATAFNEQQRQFENLLEVGKVYRFSGGHVKPIDPKFNKLAHPCELSFGTQTRVLLMENSNVKISYEFRRISDISELTAGTKIDVVGVIIDSQDIASVNIKNRSEPTPKKTLSILDDSNTSITVTFWGRAAQKLHSETKKNDVIVIKSAQVSDFNQKSLNCGDGTVFEVEPTDIPEASNLKMWYEKNSSVIEQGVSSLSLQSGMKTGSTLSTISNLRRVTINDLVDQKQKGNFANQTPQKALFLKINCYISRIRSTSNDKLVGYYNSCSKCKKSRTTEEYCEHCQDHQLPVKQYKMFMRIQDQDDSASAEILGETVGHKLFGMKADEFFAKSSAEQDDITAEQLSRMFTCTVKVSEYSGNIRYNIITAEPTDYAALAREEDYELVVSRLVVQNLLS
ncbi:putative ssDNA-binding protein [Tieghemostelium lacteum]|uniref:Putative ssDNA-binding protein n=1 Tax=Tieghemostelium lacteum TaxID=361077 RepID=A0A151Z787_TIELA|nr:putative ssDNA-binding protein [Tieghemostelium lacteum]|eukprot:KYQ89831.1 putative ssDNA-binding protein [Tieghemostelium lacteum]